MGALTRGSVVGLRTCAAALGLLAGLCAAPVGAQVSTYLTDTGTHNVPSIGRPGLRSPIVDPVFGATVTRITDASMIPDDPDHPARGLRHEYSRYPGINSNNTLMAVIVIGGVDRGALQIREIASGRLLRTVPRDGVDTEGSFHPEDPNLLFYRYSNQARCFHVDTAQVETLMAFPEYGVIRTRQEGRPSDDWRYFSFLGYPPGRWDTAEMVVADLQEKRVLARMKASPAPDWVGMSPSGRYVVAMYTDKRGTCLYRRDDLSYLGQLFPDFTHGDFVLDGAGDDCMVYYACTAGQVAEVGNRTGIACARLRDQAKTFLLNNHANWGVHVSGIGSRLRKGWALISTYNRPTAAQTPFAREIFWLKMDGSGSVRRIAHHHSDPTMDASGNKDYFAEPQALSTFDGSKVLFSSVWGEPLQRYDLYMVTGNWFPPLSQTDQVPPHAPTGVKAVPR